MPLPFLLNFLSKDGVKKQNKNKQANKNKTPQLNQNQSQTPKSQTNKKAFYPQIIAFIAKAIYLSI